MAANRVMVQGQKVSLIPTNWLMKIEITNDSYPCN